MGFRLDRTYALRWSGDLEGFEVDIRSTSIATMNEVTALRLGEDAAVTRLAEILTQHIKRWNYEGDDGEILPITVESLLQLEQVVLKEIGREWWKAAAGVTAPLDLNSIEHESSELEPSLPMEVL